MYFTCICHPNVDHPKLRNYFQVCITWCERQGRTAVILVVSNCQSHVFLLKPTLERLYSRTPLFDLNTQNTDLCAQTDADAPDKNMYLVGSRFRFLQSPDRIFSLEYHFYFTRIFLECSAADSKVLGPGVGGKSEHRARSWKHASLGRK